MADIDWTKMHVAVLISGFITSAVGNPAYFADAAKRPAEQQPKRWLLSCFVGTVVHVVVLGFFSHMVDAVVDSFSIASEE